MNFKLYFSGTKGNISASLYADGDALVATTTGLRSARAARKWGAGESELHKQAATPLHSASEIVSVSGHKTFTV